MKRRAFGEALRDARGENNEKKGSGTAARRVLAVDAANGGALKWDIGAEKRSW
ncbi:MAG: hypothetical protein J6K25_08755 [Thermoguttaceae bacterium]|nr:hypothetical protein [Thermoguttaceae bacterium]